MAPKGISLAALMLVLALAAGTARAQARNRTRVHQKPYQAPHPCEKSSCYPATGNLLIGRESKLSASSTCGLDSRERYCIVSHLEDGKKCFWCETRPETEPFPMFNHRVSNIIYRYYPGTKQLSWWQSRNGVENVTLRLDLEAEFHFTHLIIVFKTFRPAAMLVERSFDFGKTWRVYRYFAHNCAEAFPHAPRHSPRTLTDVVCESRYSSVAPSSGGEIIFRVLPPNIVVDNPYSQEVQNLLKMTNLRINFTKLHTLGDDLLDDRAEIQEKYYYAVSDITVRGSCSCYGHASRCLPLPGVESKTDMVHGRCECTHNTKGLNCELCEDFFNDLPWKPAIGKTTNACKRCVCNNHATSCHFDAAVYELTGKVSGGVCDECQHNTMGRNCERCKEYYYRDPDLDLQDPDACKPCDCDPRGSLDDAICDPETDPANGQEAGNCHCKTNVEGRRCDSCKNGFWDFDETNPDGCRECTCNPLGTVENKGCDVFTGECTCKRYVTGRDCNQCLKEFYGLADDDVEGCKPCDCDVGGALDNDCDVITGQCLCRPNVGGRRCDKPLQHHFSGALDRLVYEAETSHCSSELDDNSIGGDCQIIAREPFRDGREETWTGIGFMKVFEDNHLEFVIDDIRTSMEYDVLIRYEPQIPGNWERTTTVLARPGPVGADSPCANADPRDDTAAVVLPDDRRAVFVEPSVCLEAGKEYVFKIFFERHDPLMPNARATVLIDSIVLVPKMLTLPFFAGETQAAEARRLEFQRSRCDDAYYFTAHKNDAPDVCKQYHTSIGFYVFNGAISCQCDPTGSYSYQCEEYGGRCRCKPNVVGLRCDRCRPGTYGFGPEGCKACDCNNIGALDNFCDTGGGGQCKCRPNTYGRQCDECQPGYWNWPSCQQCECNGHADVCESKTGACISCRGSTEGHRCDRCVEGYYGDPRLGVDIPCRQCPCPGTIGSNNTFATRCILDEYTKDVVCECDEGYAGSRCDVCADNYFGHPETPGGSCAACDCNDNVDVTRPGNCDPHTGKCLQCLHDTAGDHCETCKDDFFLDSEACVRCECNLLGTNATVGSCDKETGQCPCHRNVIGRNCSECIENHWRLASGEGCDPCDCDPVGSLEDQCNPYTGQCVCKEGFGGRQCDECQTDYWGDPEKECFLCNCNLRGSSSRQCMKDTGACICEEGIGGHYCDQCARGYIGQMPMCSPCGECFDNWDRIISALTNETNAAISKASTIKTIGATGAYTRDFEEMEATLNNVQNLIKSTNLGKTEMNKFDEQINDLKKSLEAANETVSKLNIEQNEATTDINFAKVDLSELRDKSNKLRDKSVELDESATILQEANLEGALNLTRDAKQRAMDAADKADDAQYVVQNAERQIKNTQLLITRQYGSFNATQKENDKDLNRLGEKLRDLESHIPELNDIMCGQASDSCELCGGASCGKCGGLSCERGAVTKADQAHDYANAADKLLKDQESVADNLLREISTAKQDTIVAKKAAQDTFTNVSAFRNYTDNLTKESSDLTRNMQYFLSNMTVTPASIRTSANDIMKMKIDLLPEQITDLALEINSTISQLTDIESIIEETRDNLLEAEELEERAMDAKTDALDILDNTENVILALQEATLAQQLATSAIQKANEDIDATKIDLKPISNETDEAQKIANETLQRVDSLHARLNTLNKNNLVIDNDAKHVKDEANAVVMIAEAAQQQARELRQKYQATNSSLAEKVNQSADSRERAESLLKRATHLAADTQNQLKQLQKMEDLYNSYSASLANLETHINGLNNQIDHYLNEITRKSDHYRTCTN